MGKFSSPCSSRCRELALTARAVFPMIFDQPPQMNPDGDTRVDSYAVFAKMVEHLLNITTSSILERPTDTWDESTTEGNRQMTFWFAGWVVILTNHLHQPQHWQIEIYPPADAKFDSDPMSQTLACAGWQYDPQAEAPLLPLQAV